MLTGTPQDLSGRKIKETTCAKYGYWIGDDRHGNKVHIANYRNRDGHQVAQKIRGRDKSFSVVGDGSEMDLFGQHLWNGGKSVVITEGEIDALSVAQAFDCKWPVVSLPKGASGARKAIERAYEWLSGFDKIVLCFDMDDPGREAVEAVAPLLPPGRAFIMDIPGGHKDASDLLIAEGPGAITKAFWQARQWKPDGIMSGQDIGLEDLQDASEKGYSLPYPTLTEKLGGLRKRELTMLTAGSGIGKSTAAREIAYHLHQVEGLTIGNVYLEESYKKTAQGYVAIHNNVPLGRLRANKSILTDEQWEQSLSSVIKERMYFYDHFGSLESDRLLAKLRYMAVVLGCDFIVLDHISIVVSGQTASSEGERRDIDILMTKLRSLIEETGVGIIAITHLSQPQGTSHEEGGRVTLNQLRGSGSLKQLSDNVIALERDQQGDTANESDIRVLKCREFGTSGLADRLMYSPDTGRLQAIGSALGMDI